MIQLRPDTSPTCHVCGHSQDKHTAARHRHPGQPACKGTYEPCSCHGFVHPDEKPEAKAA